MISALEILVLAFVLGKFYSFGPAVYPPFLFFAGDELALDSTAFAGLVTRLRALPIGLFDLVFRELSGEEKSSRGAALRRGRRPVDDHTPILVLIFLLLFLFSVRRLLKDFPAARSRKAIVQLGLVGLFFLVGAAPQLVVNKIAHGSAFCTS